MVNILYSIEYILNEKILGVPRRWVIQQTRWLSPLVIIGVLLFSVALGYKATPSQLQLILVALPAIGVILVFVQWPVVGLLAVIASIAIPFHGPSNSNATMALVGFLLGLWLLNMMVIQREIKLIPSITILPLLMLVVVAILSFGMGQLPWYTFAQSAPLGAQLGGLALFILSAGLFLLVIHQVHDVRWLEWAVWLFLAIGGVYIIGRLVSPIGSITEQFFVVGATGSLFWTWLVALSFSQSMFNTKLPVIWRGAIGVLLIGTLYVAVIKGWAWNSGWVPPLTAIVAILWAGAPRLGLLATMAGAVAGTTKLQKIIDAVMVGDNSYSLSTRQEAWAIVWEITKVNPILGLGPANYYWYTPLFPIRGWAVQFNSHSQYIDLIAQTGILGLLCFCWFFGTLGWLSWQMRNRVPAGFAQAYVYGAAGGVVGTFTAAVFGDWVIPFFYNINMGGFRSSMLSWLFLGGLVALHRLYITSNASTSGNN